MAKAVPSLQELMDTSGPPPGYTSMVTLLIADVKPGILEASSSRAIGDSVGAELATKSRIPEIHETSLNNLRDIFAASRATLAIYGLPDDALSARETEALTEVEAKLQEAHDDQVAAHQRLTGLTPYKHLANAILNERDRLARPTRWAIALLCGLAVGGSMATISYRDETRADRPTTKSAPPPPRATAAPYEPYNVDAPFVLGAGVMGLGGGLAIGSFSSEFIVGRAARYRARKTIQKARGPFTAPS